MNLTITSADRKYDEINLFIVSNDDEPVLFIVVRPRWNGISFHTWIEGEFCAWDNPPLHEMQFSGNMEADLNKAMTENAKLLKQVETGDWSQGLSSEYIF